MSKPYRQVKLKSGTLELVTNLQDHPALREGNSVTLKDYPEPDRRWEIVWAADTARERSQLNTRWRVGGLF